jgi:hypothetical protein
MWQLLAPADLSAGKLVVTIEDARCTRLRIIFVERRVSCA